MVSIHRVSVIAYLIIRVIYFTFRFKSGSEHRTEKEGGIHAAF